MDLQFAKKRISCLDPVLWEVQNCEQTQQIRLSDGLPDIGSVLSAWGQVILRGKEWQGDTISLTGGMMVWVLYAPEDGSQTRCIDAWVPFQMKWNLPEGTPEGKIRIRCLPRFVDGRNVSPRKLLIRCGIAALAEGLAETQQEIFYPEQPQENLELLKTAYPVRLMKEAGEKTFALEEDLVLPESAPQPEKLIFCRVEPNVTEKKVLTDKIAFRGAASARMLYCSEEGQLHSWDFSVPFSQVAELEQEHSTEAELDVVPAITGLEADLDDEGHLRLKCGVTAQYLITDRELVEVIEDAYSPELELRQERETLSLPVILDTFRESQSAEQTIPAEANLAADVTFLPDFPRMYRNGDRVELDIPGNFQVLYYGEDSALHSVSGKWEGHSQLPMEENVRLTAVPLAAEPQASVGNGQISVKADLTMDLTCVATQSIPMVTAVEALGKKIADPNRPALILCRAGSGRLWDLAKSSGSTMEAIRRVNQLQGEPAPDQMLLIPVV